MSIDFHSKQNRSSYATRKADDSWVQTIKAIYDVTGKNVLDIGCGGGIYTKALIKMGGSDVTGLDFSEEQLAAAREHCKEFTNIHFQTGNALETRLDNDQFDMVLTRAVIHHIKDIKSCFKEIFRILKPGGICIIQDRTPEDCLLPGSENHIRGYFFSKFPDLINKETARRYSSQQIRKALAGAGFIHAADGKLWEVRETYPSFAELETDLLNRTG